MQLNTNFLNLVTQLFNTLQASGIDDPLYRHPDAEVARLRDLAYREFITSHMPEDDPTDEGSLHKAENTLGHLQFLFFKRTPV